MKKKLLPTRPAFVASALAAALGGAPGLARANPRPLPFSYPAETLPAEALEVEQIVDITPIMTLDNSGEHKVPRTTLTTEFEYGITDRLELGLYIQLADDPIPGSEGALRFDGLKQRLRWRISDPLTWPLDVALYGEVAELRSEIEVEGKLILQRRLGPVRLLTNLWAEREFYYSGRREWVLHPTLGASYQLSPRFSFGVEGWLVREIADEDPPPGADDFNVGPLGYLGPALFAQGGHGWIAVGAYRRVTDYGRDPRLGDVYGRYWFRVMLGIDL